jgi:hypothetical protein
VSYIVSFFMLCNSRDITDIYRKTRCSVFSDTGFFRSTSFPLLKTTLEGILVSSDLLFVVSDLQYSTVQYSTVQYSTVQYSTVQSTLDCADGKQQR